MDRSTDRAMTLHEAKRGVLDAGGELRCAHWFNDHMLGMTLAAFVGGFALGRWPAARRFMLRNGEWLIESALASDLLGVIAQSVSRRASRQNISTPVAIDSSLKSKSG